jgi:hypothetical protein
VATHVLLICCYVGPHTLKGLHDAATALLTGVRITRAASLDEFVDFTTNNPERAKVCRASQISLDDRLVLIVPGASAVRTHRS